MTTKIKERGILMHARSVNGILAGRKTQTRRIIKPQPVMISGKSGYSVFTPEGSVSLRGHTPSGDYGEQFLKCPQGQPGDRLWVKEAMRAVKEPGVASRWAAYEAGPVTMIGGVKMQPLVYEHNGDHKPVAGVTEWRWKRDRLPSMSMPASCSRITLEVVNVRVERVQDISEVDVLAEGCGPDMLCTPAYAARHGLVGTGHDHKFRFRCLWDDTNGKCAWDRNDWVWVIEFKRIQETA